MREDIDNAKRPNKDIMYEFFQNPTRENFTGLVSNHTGEQNNIDFKFEWIRDQKIAQIMLGMANTGGGAIIFGVAEDAKVGTTNAIGLNKIEDKGKLNSQIRRYIPQNLNFDIANFDYSGEEYSKLKDKKFQVLLVYSEDKYLPYICTKSGEELKNGSVYVRRGTETLLANEVEIQKIINKRIETMYSNTSELELQEHISQLKILYENIEKEKSTLTSSVVESLGSALSSLFGVIENTENELYPEEDFDHFIVRMIEEKKRKIEGILDLK